MPPEPRQHTHMPRLHLAQIIVLLVALVALMVAIPSQAQQPRTPVNVDALGPQVGDGVPDVRLPDQHGTVQTLDSIMGPNGAMLLFHRSADW